MNKYLMIVITTIFILLGGSFVLFAMRMIWLPPTQMGMMMNSNMMVHHMNSWFRGTIFFIVLFVVIFLILYFKKEK